METLIHADIFFLITSIVVVFFAIVVLVALYYVIHILRSVRYVVDKIRSESDHVSEDIAQLRGQIKERGLKFGTIFRTLAAFSIGKVGTRRRRMSDKQSK
ncbi:MAG: hypothetical protein V4664_03585 [Patescibacteria group bacterium]